MSRKARFRIKDIVELLSSESSKEAMRKHSIDKENMKIIERALHRGMWRVISGK